jgi:Tfp pilus assembly protein PilF
VVGERVGRFRITRQLRGKATVLDTCRLLGRDLEEGRAECEPALRPDAQVPEGHFRRRSYLARTGNTEGARREFEMAMESALAFLAEQARR